VSAVACGTPATSPSEAGLSGIDRSSATSRPLSAISSAEPTGASASAPWPYVTSGWSVKVKPLGRTALTGPPGAGVRTRRSTGPVMLAGTRTRSVSEDSSSTDGEGTPPNVTCEPPKRPWPLSVTKSPLL